ncbi:hypothetical protein [Methylobacter sp. YRD-M1]|uniref:hypothetical protein n=1 Tax=Methylobacter sp. YRD-M1 TaxID=2911520 RepID=UPI00227C37BA|nr:hypothetical protein [Methylobacter sp. YRD-M1]WAK02098.1 hypothetical protein LZ558_20160 [Methylobacter sp. YRD-M1]
MNRQIKQFLTWLSVASDIYRVPLAAAVIGWLVAARDGASDLDWIGFESSLRLALAVPLFFVYGTKMLVAALLFLPPGTTLFNTARHYLV